MNLILELIDLFTNTLYVLSIVTFLEKKQLSRKLSFCGKVTILRKSYNTTVPQSVHGIF